MPRGSNLAAKQSRARKQAVIVRSVAIGLDYLELDTTQFVVIV